MRDKYRFNQLQVGQSVYVKGSTPLMVAQCCYKHRLHHPELRERKFKSESAFGGVIVERVR